MKDGHYTREVSPEELELLERHRDALIPIRPDDRVPFGTAALIGPDGLEGVILNVDKARNQSTEAA